MALTDINSEVRLVQQTFADHLEKVLGWDSVYVYSAEAFGPHGMLGRTSAPGRWGSLKFSGCAMEPGPVLAKPDADRSLLQGPTTPGFNTRREPIQASVRITPYGTSSAEAAWMGR